MKYNFDDVYQYPAHWSLLNQGVLIMQLSSTIVDFYLFYDGLVWYANMSPSDKKSV